MKFWLTLVVSVLLVCAAKGSDASEKKTAQSKHAISIHRVKELLLGRVHFFAVANTPECTRCAEFMEKIPEFNKELATVNKTLRMYTVDDLAFNAMFLEKRNPRLPSVTLLVAGGDSVAYYYYPSPDLVRAFAEDVLQSTVQKIEPPTTIEEFQRSAKVTVLFVVDDEDKEVHFITRLARRNLKVKFGYVMKGSSNAKGLTDYVYVNIINLGLKSMGHAPLDEIARFVKVRTRLPLYEIPRDTALVLSAYEDNVILYVNKFEFIICMDREMEWLEDLGNALRGEFVVACSDTVTEIALRDFELLHLSRDERRGVRILVKSTSKVYRMEDHLDGRSLNDSITKETIMAFVKVFRTGKLKPYAMSARLLRDWDKRPMKIIVANNYTEFVSKDTHTVAVLLYYPDHVNAIATMRKVAEHFIDSEDVLIARMDMTENDLPERYAAIGKQLPAVRLYEKYTNKEVPMREEITVENIKKFIDDATKRLDKAANEKMKKTNETTEATKPPLKGRPATPEAQHTKAAKHEEL